MNEIWTTEPEGTPDVGPPSEALQRALTDAGFVPDGLLCSRWSVGASLTMRHALWRSHSGTTWVVAMSGGRVDEILALSLLENGRVVATAWATHPHGMNHRYDLDPDLDPSWTGDLPRSVAQHAARGHVPRWGVDSLGGAGTIEGGLESHRARVQEHATSGEPELALRREQVAGVRARLAAVARKHGMRSATDGSGSTLVAVMAASGLVLLPTAWIGPGVPGIQAHSATIVLGAVLGPSPLYLSVMSPHRRGREDTGLVLAATAALALVVMVAAGYWPSLMEAVWGGGAATLAFLLAWGIRKGVDRFCAHGVWAWESGWPTAEQIVEPCAATDPTHAIHRVNTALNWAGSVTLVTGMVLLAVRIAGFGDAADLLPRGLETFLMVPAGAFFATGAVLPADGPVTPRRMALSVAWPIGLVLLMAADDGVEWRSVALALGLFATVAVLQFQLAAPAPDRPEPT